MFHRLRRACFHPPSKLGGIQQASFITLLICFDPKSVFDKITEIKPLQSGYLLLYKSESLYVAYIRFKAYNLTKHEWNICYE